MKYLSMLATLVSGMLFGFGLAFATMIQPEVVLGFLTFSDWGLLLVMGGAIAITLPGFYFVPRLLNKPLFTDSKGLFDRYTSGFEKRIVIGAAIFGIGWGISGVCPGPAIAGIGAGNWQLIWAIAGILTGALLQGLTASK